MGPLRRCRQGWQSRLARGSPNGRCARVNARVRSALTFSARWHDSDSTDLLNSGARVSSDTSLRPPAALHGLRRRSIAREKPSDGGNCGRIDAPSNYRDPATCKRTRTAIRPNHERAGFCNCQFGMYSCRYRRLSVVSGIRKMTHFGTSLYIHRSGVSPPPPYDPLFRSFSSQLYRSGSLYRSPARRSFRRTLVLRRAESRAVISAALRLYVISKERICKHWRSRMGLGSLGLDAKEES